MDMSVGQLVAAATRQLAHSDTARLDAEILLAHALDITRSQILARPERIADTSRQALFAGLINRRAAGEPVAYLLGEQEFWSLTLKVTPAVLVPRPETEMLVELCLDLDSGPDRILRVADLGTGSGAIALALASERPDWQLVATDESQEALIVARQNARLLGLERVHFIVGSWCNALSAEKKFDVIVSNPPYIDPRDPHLVSGSLRFEPVSALAAADQGLADISVIARQTPAHLVPGGWLLLEHGHDQGVQVKQILQANGFREVSTRQDLAGLDRVTLGRNVDDE